MLQPVGGGPSAPPAPQPPPPPLVTAVDNGQGLPIGQWRVPRWAVKLVGHVVAAVIGLAMGYFVLHMIKPHNFPLPW